jgi:hypothetical protein
MILFKEQLQKKKKIIWQTKDRQVGSYIHQKMPDV